MRFARPDLLRAPTLLEEFEHGRILVIQSEFSRILGFRFGLWRLSCLEIVGGRKPWYRRALEFGQGIRSGLTVTHGCGISICDFFSAK
jgi:hypothetical protein